MAIVSINGNTPLQSGSFPPVRVASTGSALSPSTGGLLVVDGIQTIAGDRVLCKDETSAVDNGIYIAATGSWSRAPDAAGNQQFSTGMAVTVGLGAINAGITYLCTSTDDPVIVGTSLITFVAQGSVATAKYIATSVTPTTIGTGSKTFVTQAGKSFSVGQWVLVQETSNAANQMFGKVTSYTGTSIVVSVTAIGGSGSLADWTIVLSNSAAAAGYQPPVGTGNVTGPGGATAGHAAIFADSTGLVLSDAGGSIPAGSVSASALLQSSVALGVNMLNGQIVATPSAGALTLAVQTLAGANPSASDPVWFVFRSAAATTGAPVLVAVTAALSVSIPSGSTLGFATNTPGRVWLTAVNNAGTVSLAVINCLTLTLTGTVPTNLSIYPLAGWGIASITATGGGANNAGVLYGSGSLANVGYSTIGYVCWEAPVTMTAGTWVAPSRVVVRTPDVPLPGQAFNQQFTINSTTTSVTTGGAVTATTDTITLSSSANLVFASGDFNVAYNGSVPAGITGRFTRGSGPTLFGNESYDNKATALNSSGHVSGFDFPAVLTSVTYSIYGTAISNTVTYNSNGNSSMTLQEIMT